MDFISDEEMERLEKSQQLPDVLTDAEMAQLETKVAPARKSARQFIEENMITPDQITAGANNAAAMMSGGLSKAIPAMARGIKRFAAPFIEGGLSGAAQAPEEDKLAGFLKGSASQGGLATAGKVLGKAGDIGMQLAVGRKKYTPGVGTQLADQGLVGTREMMARQTESKLADAGEQMLTAAQGARPINARRIGREIYEQAARPIATDGMGRPMNSIANRDRPAIEAIMEFADDVKSRRHETAVEGLGRRRAAGSSAYSMKSGDPKQSQMAQLSKLEQQKYSQALKEADPTGKLAEADNTYAALKRAQRGLNEEPTMTGLGFISRPISLVGGAFPTSIAAQAAVKSSKSNYGLEKFLAPLSKQIAVSDEAPTDEEIEAYKLRVRQTGQK